MNAACPHCRGALFFHVLEADIQADQGLIVHAIGLPKAVQVFRGTIPPEIACPHCGGIVAVPRSRTAAVDAFFGGLDDELFGLGGAR